MSTINKFGAWNLVASQLRHKANEVEKAIDKGFGKIALAGEAIVLSHIQNQDLPWEPLAESYRAKKRQQGYSDNIYVRTGSYFKEVKGWHDDKKVYVGIPENTLNYEGNALDVIAQTLEYGSHKLNIPPRPLMEPSMEETKKKTNDIMKQVLKEVLGL